MDRLAVVGQLVQIRKSVSDLIDAMKDDLNDEGIDPTPAVPEVKRKIISWMIAIGALTAVGNGLEGTEKMMRMADMYEQVDAKGKSGKSGLS